MAQFFDIGQSRALAWARRPQAAALVGALADPNRGWDAIVIGNTSGRSTAAADAGMTTDLGPLIVTA